MNFLSHLYAFMYWSRQRSFLGFAVGTWLLLLPLLLFLVGLLARWPLTLNFIFLGLAVLIFVTYVLAKRVGYKRFVPDTSMTLDMEFAAPHNEQRVPLRATGIFSVREREDYVLERPSEYWRVPLGQHIFMVQHQPGRYLYQIIDHENVQAVEPGHLLFGREPQKALALQFRVTWGPDFANDPRFSYTGGTSEGVAGPRVERTVYLTFDHDADRYAVWRSLTRGQSAN